MWPNESGFPLNPEKMGVHMMRDNETGRVFFNIWYPNSGWPTYSTSFASQYEYLGECVNPTDMDIFKKRIIDAMDDLIKKQLEFISLSASYGGPPLLSTQDAIRKAEGMEMLRKAVTSILEE